MSVPLREVEGGFVHGKFYKKDGEPIWKEECKRLKEELLSTKRKLKNDRRKKET